MRKSLAFVELRDVEAHSIKHSIIHEWIKTDDVHIQFFLVRVIIGGIIYSYHVSLVNCTYFMFIVVNSSFS